MQIHADDYLLKPVGGKTMVSDHGQPLYLLGGACVDLTQAQTGVDCVMCLQCHTGATDG